MSAERALLGYAACGLVLIVYAWLRSTTPAGLAFLMLAYLLLGAAAFAHFENLAAGHRGVRMLSAIAHLQLVTSGLLGWLIVHRAVTTNTPGVSPCFTGFLIKGFSAVLVAIGISLVAHAAESDPLAGARDDLRAIVIGFPLCLAAAFFRHYRIADGSLPTWLRWAENCGCISTMVLGLLVLYLGQLAPLPIDTLHGWRLAVTLTLPAALAMVIGGCVRVIGRAEFRDALVAPEPAVRHHQS
jgi:hypothetical protein